MTQVYHLGRVHLTPGKPRGWLLVVGRHVFSGPRFWFGWSPGKVGCARKGCGHEQDRHYYGPNGQCVAPMCRCVAYVDGSGWRWQPDGGWAWRWGSWEAGADTWGLVPIVAGALVAAAGLAAFLWRIL